MRAQEQIVQNILTGAFYEDPYPTYRLMREEARALFIEPLGTWVLTGFDEVYTALRRHDVFSSTALSGQGPDQSAGQVVLISDDPPRHTALRGLVNRAFTPARIKEMEAWIQSIVDGLLADFGDGEADVVEVLSVPLPVTVIAELMGIPAHDREKFKRWSDALIAESAEEDEQRRAEMREMGEYFARVLDERRSHPASDLFTALAEAEIGGQRLQDWEIIAFATLLLVAGNETTTNLISNMLNVLAASPELWARLRGDPSVVDAVIEETLRYDSPVQTLPRVTLSQARLGAATVPAGSRLLVSFGAANRDPLAFPDPDEFRLDRDLGRHIAFGYGIHFCLGAPLARTEARIALNALLDRFPGLEPGSVSGTRQRASLIIRGFTSLPLRFQR